MTRIFPTIVDDSKFFRFPDSMRGEIRNKLGITNKEVYIYVGGTDIWQNIGKIISTFEKISRNSDRYYLLMIVKKPSEVSTLVSESGINPGNVLVTSASYSEVPQWLNAANYGIIIREDNIVNFVASPTKINEYLACGLTIVTRLDEIGSHRRNNLNENSFYYKPLNTILEEQSLFYNVLSNTESTQKHSPIK